MKTNNYDAELLPQQNNLIVDFMDSLEKDDIDLFWSTLSKEFKAFFNGTFVGKKKSGISFEEWKQELFRETKEGYADFIGNYGISTIVRYSNKLFAHVHLPYGVKVPITYIAETEVRSIIIPILLEFDLTKDGELTAEWRVYIQKQA